MDSNVSTTQNDNLIPSYAVYILYILSAFSGGAAGLVGLIVAYVCKSDSELASSHRQYQIRQFWLTVLYVIIAIITFFIGLGVFIGIGVAIWSIVRPIVGLKCLYQNKPIANPTTWWM